MTKPSATITVPDVLPRVRELYEREPAGCCLHIVLDDGNTEDSSVDFCIDYAEKREHGGCAGLARTLRQMSRTQRAKLCRLKRSA